MQNTAAVAFDKVTRLPLLVRPHPALAATVYEDHFPWRSLYLWTSLYVLSDKSKTGGQELQRTAYNRFWMEVNIFPVGKAFVSTRMKRIPLNWYSLLTGLRAGRSEVQFPAGGFYLTQKHVTGPGAQTASHLTVNVVISAGVKWLERKLTTHPVMYEV